MFYQCLFKKHFSEDSDDDAFLFKTIDALDGLIKTLRRENLGREMYCL